MPLASQWHLAAHALPRKSYGHSSCLYRGRLYLFGGVHCGEHTNQLDVLDLTGGAPTWSSQREVGGEAPTPRRLHRAAVDAGGRMHVLWGGFVTEAGEREFPH